MALIKKFLSVVLLISVVFSSSNDVKCFASGNDTLYDNCTLALKKVTEIEAQLNEIRAKNVELKFAACFLGTAAVLLLGIILGKPIWQCLNLAAWELNTWQDRLFKDVRFRRELNAQKDDIEFLHARVDGLAKKVGLPTVGYNDAAVKID